MVDEVVYDSKQYRLRAGSPMSFGTQGAGEFYLHTFMAEEYDVKIYAYTQNLPRSEEFRGQGGELLSAQFNRLQEKCGTGFAGKTIKTPKYIDEDDMGGTTE